MRNDHGGFCLAELILVVLILGILTAVAVPRLNMAVIGEQKSDAAARRIAADLRHTRQLALSRAAENPAGFGLFMEGAEPYEGYEIRDLSTSRTLCRYSIDKTVLCRGGQAFRFGPLGNLLEGSDTQLTFSSGDRTERLNIIPATGSVQCEVK